MNKRRAGNDGIRYRTAPTEEEQPLSWNSPTDGMSITIIACPVTDVLCAVQMMMMMSLSLHEGLSQKTCATYMLVFYIHYYDCTHFFKKNFNFVCIEAALSKLIYPVLVEDKIALFGDCMILPTIHTWPVGIDKHDKRMHMYTWTH